MSKFCPHYGQQVSNSPKNAPPLCCWCVWNPLLGKASAHFVGPEILEQVLNLQAFFCKGDHIMLIQPSNKHVCSLVRGWLRQSVPKVLSLPIVLPSVPDYTHYLSWIHQQYHISFSRFSKRFLGRLLSQPDQLPLSPHRVEHGQGPTSLKNHLDLKKAKADWVNF